MRVPKDFNREQGGRRRMCAPSPPREAAKMYVLPLIGHWGALMKCLTSSGKGREVKEPPCKVSFRVKFPFVLGAAQAKEQVMI